VKRFWVAGHLFKDLSIKPFGAAKITLAMKIDRLSQQLFCHTTPLDRQV
jgi:hypothetical protein